MGDEEMHFSIDVRFPVFPGDVGVEHRKDDGDNPRDDKGEGVVLQLTRY